MAAYFYVCDEMPVGDTCPSGFRIVNTDDFRDFPDLTISDAGQIATAILLLWSLAYVGRLIRKILEKRH